MKNLIRPLAVAVLLLAAPSAFADERPPPHVTVTGEGEASIRPDMALVNLSVLRDAPTAREALSANNTAMAAVLKAMRDAGIAERDLQTSGFGINPRIVYPDQNNGQTEPKIVGYEVVNSLSVRVRDLDKLGAIVDQSVTLGVNQGGGIIFTNDDPAKTITEARKLAVKDAMAKAATLTEAAGVQLGAIMEVAEQGYAPPPVPFLAKAAAAPAGDSVPVASGENSYRVQVSVTFALKP